MPTKKIKLDKFKAFAVVHPEWEKDSYAISGVYFSLSVARATVKELRDNWDIEGGQVIPVLVSPITKRRKK